jgi:endonuclease/exonuclease/phosphatase family metal-dependent hydrolase
MVRLMLLAGNFVRDSLRWGLGRQSRETAVQSLPVRKARKKEESAERDSLRVMTLNLAHGRKHGNRRQVQRRHRETHMLEDVARLIQAHQPDLVALQEADARSRLRGSVNQVEKLAHDGGMAEWVQAEHVRASYLAYGTALLSNMPVSDAIACTFRPTPPTFNKGFVRATVNWPGRPKHAVDVVSVHLDFLRRTHRKRQVDEMIDTLGSHTRPLVIMGDFNSDWKGGHQTLQRLAEALKLHTFAPDQDGHPTFPVLNRRLDWILVSRDLAFRSYWTLEERVSDHRAVLAEIVPA